MDLLMKTIEEYKEEDRLQKEFIANMVDKYDYRLYERFCAEHNMRVLSFPMYAMLVDPIVVPKLPVLPGATAPISQAQTNLEPVKPCGGCGGGKVL
jgi:hypothetical protein